MSDHCNATYPLADAPKLQKGGWPTLGLVASARMVARRDKVAAANNAGWCAAVWRAHGLPMEQRQGLLFCPLETPRLYPNVVSLEQTHCTNDQVDLIAKLSRDVTFEFSVKDSFNSLPLDDIGFEPLFEASWLWQDSQSREPNEAGLFWKCIDVYQLPAWEAAWRGGDEQAERTFPDCLLDDRCVSVLAGVDPELRIVARVIAYEGAGVIGVTNAFGPELPPFVVIAALIKEAPLVAYERGGILSSALRRGFSAAGQLKIWTRSSEG